MCGSFCCRFIFPLVAQLDNAADSDSEERGFKSLRAGQKKKPVIPYVSRDCRLFSTDEGVNDFLNWLKEDSGYSKAEKKTVLQRIIDFFDRIIEAIKDTIQNGELSKTAREFAQMQADKAAQIREMFLEALDGINGKKRENAGSETKDSRKRVDFDEKIDKDKGMAHNKKRRIYNEQETLFMIWQESASTPIGEKKAFERGNAVILYEKTEGGCVELSRRKIKKEEQEYERTYRKTNESFNWYLEEVESDMGRSEENNNLHRFAGNTVRSGGQTERERLQSDTKRNNEHLLSGDNRTSDVTDSEIKNSLKQTERDKAESTQNKKRLYNESDTLFLQWSNSPSVPIGERKMFKRGNDWAWFKKTENGCVELFRGKNKKEAREYERTYRKTNESYGWYLEEVGFDMVRSGGNNNLHQLAGDTVGNGRQTGSEGLQADTERDREHLRTGIRGISDITDSEETKNSLRHSLGISDNTAEVASYYGFAAVFAALVASEAADVVDSALAAVVEFVAAALDVAVDSSAEKVPAVEDNSAKADEVSLELSAGNDVESVDELFCVPFNLKAFKKPFTPRPK